jgi:hypothetical protein
MSSARLYVVRDTATNKERLVRAGHPSTAVQHVTKDQFKAEVAKPDDIYRLASAGVQVETVGPEQQQLPTT